MFIINNKSHAITNCIFQRKNFPYNLRSGVNFCRNNMKTVKYGTEISEDRKYVLISLLEFKFKTKNGDPLPNTQRLFITTPKRGKGVQQILSQTWILYKIADS